MTRGRATTLLIAALAAAGCTGASAAGGTRKSLLAADRGAGATLETVLADDAYYLAPGLPVLEGREAIVRELGDAPGAVERLPLVAALSSDGSHGYTAGRLTRSGADSAARHGKYLAYWRHQPPAGWRLWAIVVNGSPAAPDVAPPAASASAAPRGSPLPDPATPDHLRAADTEFSDQAAAEGVGPAFRMFAGPAALLLGGPGSAMVWGDSAIGTWIGQVIPPRDGLSWAPRIAQLAPSGDLGFTIGDATYHHVPAEGEAQLSYTKYLTVWRRQPDGRWRYAADGGNDQPPPNERAGLRVRPSGGALRLVNPDTAAVFFLAFEQRATALVNWRPCVEGADCRRVPGSSERRMPFDSVPGWTAAADSITVFWWRRAAGSGRGPAFDSVRSVTVGAR